MNGAQSSFLGRQLGGFWHSPTLNTWLNLCVQSLAFLVLLPLSLRSLSDAGVSVFFLLLSVLGLQIVFNFGFQPTFARLIAYATGGLSVEAMPDLREKSRPESTPGAENANIESFQRICAAMLTIHFRLAAFAGFFLVTVGSLAMRQPISQLENPVDGWLAWGIVLSGFFLKIRYSNYQTFLTGSGHVALVQRWQALFSALSLGSMILALTLTRSISVVVLSHQLWVLLSLLCYREMAIRLSGKRFPTWQRTKADSLVQRIAWRNAWRSGLGIIGSKLSQQSLGFIYAQFGSSASVATFLIAMRLIEAVENFSMAPFYSRLPQLNKLRARSQHYQLEDLAAKRMRYAHWVYLLGFIAATAVGPLLLSHTGSDITFPQQMLWYTLGLAFMLQRFGGMHLQLYSTTNHIIWHWVSLTQGILIVGLALVLALPYQALGLAIAIFTGNLVFALICATASRSQLKKPLLKFELFNFIPAIIGFLCFLWVESKFDLLYQITQYAETVLRSIINSIS
jgi:hypothetical protein